jgi:hypothetical protein
MKGTFRKNYSSPTPLKRPTSSAFVIRVKNFFEIMLIHFQYWQDERDEYFPLLRAHQKEIPQGKMNPQGEPIEA